MIDISSICYISYDLIDIQFYSGFLLFFTWFYCYVFVKEKYDI